LLGTDVLQEPGLKAGQESLTRQCALTTVRLPIAVVSSGEGDTESFDKTALVILSEDEARSAFSWMQTKLMDEYRTFLPVFRHGSWLWTRLSGQVYLEANDFEGAGHALKDLCERVAKKEFKA
jgi:hypothetical protein